MSRQAVLKFYGELDQPVANIRAMLECLDIIYGNLVLLTPLVYGELTAKELNRLLIEEVEIFNSCGPLRKYRIVSKVLRDRCDCDDILLLHSANFSSPGFWEFLGTLNPLKLILDYLQMRHEHRKDRSYREAAERRKLELENQILELSFLEKAIGTATDAGIPQDDLIRWLSPKLSASFADLDFFLSRKLLHKAELVIPSEGIGPGNPTEATNSESQGSAHLARFRTLDIDDGTEGVGERTDE